MIRSAAEKHVQAADTLRNRGRFAEAAAEYRMALVHVPERGDLWVQLGNMEKDARRFEKAVAAYRIALERGADPSDTHLQLGRALLMAGDREGAKAAWLAGLDAGPSSRDLFRALAGIDAAWGVQERTGPALPLATGLARTLDDVAATIARVRDLAPDLARLAVFPIEHYGLYARMTTVPPPPPRTEAAPPDFALIVRIRGDGPGDGPGDGLADALAMVSDLEAQSTKPSAVVLICDDTRTADALSRRHGAVGRGRLVIARDSVSSEAAALEAALRHCDASWLAIAPCPLALDPATFEWLGFAAGDAPAEIVTVDEDVCVLGPLGTRTRSEPTLRGAFDPELIEQGFGLGTIVAARADLLAEAARAAIPDGGDWLTAWPALAAKLVAGVRSPQAIVHVPELLVSCLRRVGEAGALPVPVAGGDPLVATVCDLTIAVVVPTRDRVALLRECVDALVATAGRPDRLRIIVADNGSEAAETKSYLADAQRSGRLTIVSEPGPFNWSHLNNQAAGRSSSDIVVFCNNDVVMQTMHWDDILRRHLSRPDIGVVGARLVYPDGSLQHAGIVLGAGDFGAEHAGRNRPGSDAGPNGAWETRRTVSAVTGAWLACRRDVYVDCGGFDAVALPIWFNDIDFCLRVRGRGLRVLYEPAIAAVHHEGKTLSVDVDRAERDAQFLAAATTMADRWGALLRADPYWNPHFSAWSTPGTHLAVRNAQRSIMRVPTIDRARRR